MEIDAIVPPSKRSLYILDDYLVRQLKFMNIRHTEASSISLATADIIDEQHHSTPWSFDGTTKEDGVPSNATMLPSQAVETEFKLATFSRIPQINCCTVQFQRLSAKIL